MEYVKAFFVGGVFCVIGQILIDKTKLTPARILVSYVTSGVLLSGIGVYQPLADWAGAGATVPLTGFGHLLAKGVKKAVAEHGLLGAFTGGITTAAGGITAAVEMARRNIPHTLKIEVEIETFEQLEEALAAGADIIMLDNMSNEDMKKAVEIVAGRAITEASGNMGEKDLRAVAETGVDLISIGALTHSVKALDISLKFKF